MAGFHFPPSTLRSGHLRLLAFAKYLPEFGWDPVVLSATKGAYQYVDPDSLQAIPEGCHVHRAFALDARRHIGLFGRYPSLLARPDRWSSWWPSAVALGLWLIKRYRAEAIWSTFPIMTSHCIAHTLNRLTGIPWIAEFRDPVSSSVADDPAAASRVRWERRVISRASRSVFTTSGAMQWCIERYPEVHAQGRFTVIGNGYDETAFAGLPPAPPPVPGRPLKLLHSGLLYPEGRNPVPFFRALANLKAAGVISASSLNVVLRSSGSEPVYAREIRDVGLEQMVTLAPSVPNKEALAEQADADALLLFQGPDFDRQIPAKLYEYLRVGRPIFALVGGSGETAALLRTIGGATLVPIDDVSAIEQRLSEFIRALQDGRAPRVNPEDVQKYSRRHGAALLGDALHEVSGERARSPRGVAS